MRLGVMLAAFVLLSGCFTKEGIVTPYNAPRDVIAESATTLVGAMEYPTERQVAWLIYLQSRGELAKLTKAQATDKVHLLSLGFQCPDFRNVPRQNVIQATTMASYTRVDCPQKEPPWGPVITESLVDQVVAARAVGFMCSEVKDDPAICVAETVFPNINGYGKRVSERVVKISVALRSAQSSVVNIVHSTEFTRLAD
ncbi:MAG: hypothetical protein QM773_15710 [Hyphomonadaceae bacterium]